MHVYTLIRLLPTLVFSQHHASPNPGPIVLITPNILCQTLSRTSHPPRTPRHRSLPSARCTCTHTHTHTHTHTQQQQQPPPCSTQRHRYTRPPSPCAASVFNLPLLGSSCTRRWVVLWHSERLGIQCSIFGAKGSERKGCRTPTP